MEAIKTSVTNSPAESEMKGKAVKKSGKRIGYNYIILKSLKESQKNDVVKCLYIKSLTNFGICVIKEGTYGDSKDKQGRDIKDRLMWQKQLHESLQDKVRLPRLLGSFEENGNYYLVIERIRGKSLHKTCKEAGKELREGLITGNKLGMKFLDYMIQMIELLETLHKNGVVHRDVTATNFMITPEGKVAVIDMELSYSLKTQFPSPPFQLGTYGYMSPEQERAEMPTVDQDVFSVGAILLSIWTGISPSKLTSAPMDELVLKLFFLIPDKNFAQIILRCLDPESFKRPSLGEVRDVISRYKSELKNRQESDIPIAKKYSKDEVLHMVQQGLNCISSPLLVDEKKGWFSEDLNAPTNQDKRKINKTWYASFHNGASGIIYMLSKAKLLGFNIDPAKPFIEKGVDLIKERYISRMQTVNPGLHLGSSGIAAVLSVAMQDELLEPQNEYFEWIDQLLDKENESLGFQTGLAGQGLATFWCYPFLHRAKAESRVQNYIQQLLELQQKDGSWMRYSKKSNKERATKGFANGVAGIIYFLLEYSKRYNDKVTIECVERGLNWLMKSASWHNTSVNWKSSNNKTMAPWWCEGVTGIAMTFIKAYSVLGVRKYREFAEGALYNHPEKIIDNNLGQYRGLSGLGEVYLDAFKTFQNEEWLRRSEWIVQVLVHSAQRHNSYGPYWLVGGERQPVADFMVGNSGVIHFLLRHFYMDKIHYPLTFE